MSIFKILKEICLHIEQCTTLLFFQEKHVLLSLLLNSVGANILQSGKDYHSLYYVTESNFH